MTPKQATNSAFISYAQNLEDVMLWRALNEVENGFYIDIGAWSPDLDSVTRAFYERGWTGVNIEPNPRFTEEFESKRPRDINLQLAISNQAGEQTLHILDSSGLSTLDPRIAGHHKAEGHEGSMLTVPTSTLNQIWEQYVGARAVHFLKVDVEGLEKQVLDSNDWHKHRPWIVVVESTYPMSTKETHQEWEHILLEADYGMVYADGLNRFYLGREHSPLQRHFRYPPNVFDNYETAALADYRQRALWAERELRAVSTNPICRLARKAWNLLHPRPTR